MASRNGKKPHRKKAGKKAGTDQLVKQQHGGAIYQGPPANPVAGTGRPPAAIRETARMLFDERLPVLAKIADSEESKDSDKISAIDKLGSYGLNESMRVVTVGSQDVQDRLEHQAKLFVERLDAESLVIVRAIVNEVWQ